MYLKRVNMLNACMHFLFLLWYLSCSIFFWWIILIFFKGKNDWELQISCQFLARAFHLQHFYPVYLHLCLHWSIFYSISVQLSLHFSTSVCLSSFLSKLFWKFVYFHPPYSSVLLGCNLLDNQFQHCIDNPLRTHLYSSNNKVIFNHWGNFSLTQYFALY